MLVPSRVLDRPLGIDRALRPMRPINTPHAESSGAQPRVIRIGMLCAALLIAAAPTAVAGQTPRGAAANGGDASAARPDPQQVAMARALFEEGLRHVDAEEWALAADRFARVLALRYSAVAAYNLSLARARLGSSVLALESLRDLLAQPGLESTVRDAALALQKEQHAYVGWLTVRVHGDCDGCSVRLDDTALHDAALGVAVPVDPGHHSLALSRGEELLASTNLTVSRGARVEGNLEAPDAPRAALSPADVTDPAASSGDAAAVSAPPAALEAAPEKQSEGSLLTSPWFWGGVGVLAAGVVTVGVVLAGSGGGKDAAPIPGNFSPGVIAGEVRP
jgi:hypothetical protein